MSNMTAVELKAFVPAKDFELSKRFYEDLGFSLAWDSDEDVASHVTLILRHCLTPPPKFLLHKKQAAC